MKIYCLTLVIVLILSSIAYAEPVNDDLKLQLLDTLSTENVNKFIRQINSELHQDIPLLNKETITQIARQGIELDWQSWWHKFVNTLLKEITVNLSILGKLIFLAVLCAVLQNLQNSFANSGVSTLAYGICFIFISVIVLTAFYNAVTLARQSVGNMVGFMEALLPLLISLLAGVGALTSAALFTPLMLFVVSIVSVIIEKIVLPLLFLTAALDCINYLTDKYKLNNLSSLIKQVGLIVLGFTLVIFIGVVTIQGVAGSITDGIALRTAKYATATFIPVVGKMFADTVELVMGASLLLKNAVGIFGVIVVAMICAFPLIKLLALIIIIKITGALVQPIGDEKMAQCLDSMGNNLLIVFGAVLTVVLMFFLIITIIISLGSVTMMLR